MQRRIPTTLTQTEADALIAAINAKCPTGRRDRAIVETMLRAGLRVGEVVALTPANIRWDIRTIAVVNGKGGRDRPAPLTAPLIDALRLWADVRPPRAARFFCSLQGKRISTRAVQRRVKNLARQAGIERQVTPHTLRHTYATTTLRNGIDVHTLQASLGHSRLATTEVYLHCSAERLAEEIDRRNGAQAEHAEALKLAQTITALSADQKAALKGLLNLG